jgi:hypothetical protein
MVARHFLYQVCEYFGAARMPLPVGPVTHTLSASEARRSDTRPVTTPTHRPVTTPTHRASERASERDREAARH